MRVKHAIKGAEGPRGPRGRQPPLEVVNRGGCAHNQKFKKSFNFLAFS